eukprot:356041-Amphidinium_carterae.1
MHTSSQIHVWIALMWLRAFVASQFDWARVGLEALIDHLDFEPILLVRWFAGRCGAWTITEVLRRSTTVSCVASMLHASYTIQSKFQISTRPHAD